MNFLLHMVCHLSIAGWDWWQVDILFHLILGQSLSMYCNKFGADERNILFYGAKKHHIILKDSSVHDLPFSMIRRICSQLYTFFEVLSGALLFHQIINGKGVLFAKCRGNCTGNHLRLCLLCLTQEAYILFDHVINGNTRACLMLKNAAVSLFPNVPGGQPCLLCTTNLSCFNRNCIQFSANSCILHVIYWILFLKVANYVEFLLII